MNPENPSPAEAEQAAARLRRGVDSIYGVNARARQAGKNTEAAIQAALVGDLQSSLNEHEARQVGAIAQALHQAEKHTTSFVHNLQYHRIIAQRIYNEGVRFSENYWRVDESFTDEHDRRIHQRWPMRYQSEADAQRDIDRDESWTSYDPAKGHTDRKREIHRER